MKVFVTVIANSREPGVEEIDSTHYKVKVREPATQGKANDAVQEALSDYMEIPKSLIQLQKGHASKQKIFMIK